MIVIRKNTHCKKCNIQLHIKNEFLSAGSQGIKKGIKYRHTTCRHCVKKCNTCRIKYEDPVLNALCNKQAVNIYNKIYFLKNREVIKTNSKRTKNVRRNNLTDSIIMHDIMYSDFITRLVGRQITK